VKLNTTKSPYGAAVFLVTTLLWNGCSRTTQETGVPVAEARQIAKEAYIYGFPLVTNYQTLYKQAVDSSDRDYRAPFNTVGRTTGVATAEDKFVVTPNYQSSETLPLSICATTGVALRERENWALDIDELHVALKPYTKLILINFPHNPTGKVIDHATFNAVVQLCRERGIYLFSVEAQGYATRGKFVVIR